MSSELSFTVNSITLVIEYQHAQDVYAQQLIYNIIMSFLDKEATTNAGFQRPHAQMKMCIHKFIQGGIRSWLEIFGCPLLLPLPLCNSPWEVMWYVKSSMFLLYTKLHVSWNSIH